MVNEDIKLTVEELSKLIDIEKFIGKAIETEDKILIPVMRMGVAFGGGSGIIATDNTSAAAAGVEPIAMVVLPKGGKGAEGIRVLNLTKGSDVNKAISDLGLVVTDLIREYLEDQKVDKTDHGVYKGPNFTDDIEVEPKK